MARQPGTAVLPAGTHFAFLAVAMALTLLAGCDCPQGQPGQHGQLRQPGTSVALAGERFSGENTATPIFGPLIAAADPTQEPAAVTPIEEFNWRPVWPAVGGVNLGEVTYYREWYYDSQGGNNWARSHVGGYFSRTFQSYRTGVIVK